MLYARRPGDYAFVILNRLHANNFRQLCGDIESHQQDDGLIMYSTHSGAIFGLWIYSEEEKEQFCQWLARIQVSRAASPMVAICVPPEEGTGAANGAKGADLRTLLGKAVERSRSDSSVARLEEQFLEALLDRVDEQHGNRLPLSQFKRVVLDTMAADSAFWEDLYGTYVERRLTKYQQQHKPPKQF